MPWVFDFSMNQNILVEMLDFCTNRKLEHIFLELQIFYY